MPLWVALAITTFALIAWVFLQKRAIDRHIDSFRDVEAERLAREASAPLGNCERFFG
jgi:hypothetical protein